MSVLEILLVLDVFKAVSLTLGISLPQTCRCCTGTITCLEFYGSSHLLSGGEDGLLCVWNTKKWQCLKSIKAHKYADQDAAKTEIVVSVVFLDEETWTQLSSFVSQRLSDVTVCPSFWQTRTYSWGGPNSKVKFRHAANWVEVKLNQHWLLSIFYFQNMESN